MEPTFGARLRSQRERRQVSLAAIAEQTKIRASLLEALERDDVSRWPGGVFRRAYVRSYAVAIGADADAVVREFVERFPDPNEEPAVPAVALAAGKSPTRFSLLLESAVGSLSARRAKPAPVADCPAFDEEMSYAAAAMPLATADDCEAAIAPAAPPLDLRAAADLCGRLARASDARGLAGVLADAAEVMGDARLILWLWDGRSSALRPVLSHGYADAVLAQLDGVARDADNAIAAAFRTSEERIVEGAGNERGALVLPLASPQDCPGVLAIELGRRGERRPDIRALAAILAAQLSALVGIPAA